MSKDDSAQVVFSAQLAALLDAAQLAIGDIGKDQDIEYLHQYRVSLRKARALLRTFRGVFTKNIVLKMETDVKALFCASAQVRDLDLLLIKLQQGKFKHIFSDTALITAIRVKRQQEFAGFLSVSQTSEFSQRFVHLQACLTKVQRSGSQVSLQDCWPDLINKSIADVKLAYKKVWKKKNNRHIHSLRKSLKQLRYCLALLGVLLKPRKAKKALAYLKKQQRSLGDYNDLMVQCALLKAYAQANKKILRALFNGDQRRLRKALPLSKSDWKDLKQKLQPMLG